MAVCAAATLAASSASASSEPRVQASAKPEPRKQSFSEPVHFGIIVDLGLPDMAGVGLVVRPLTWLRLHGSAATNAVSFGLRGGLTYVPFHYWISPSVTLEGGHFFEGNANRITARFGVESGTLDAVSYSYGNAHLGIELGDPDGFTLFIHAGLTVGVAKLSGTRNELDDDDDDTSTSIKSPSLTYVGPSGKVGFVMHF